MAVKDKFSKMILRNGRVFHIAVTHDNRDVETLIQVRDQNNELLATAKVCRLFYFTFEIYRNGKTNRGKRRLSKFTPDKEPRYYSTPVAAWLVDHHAPKLK
ncbi:hypothetical protein S1R3X_000031 [Vibrio phage vB_ValS_VA-RY-4]|nr:hypothetical protein ValSw41_67 [Vibrio phage ValSw4_1]QQO38333.1 hypothetical protein [Vibrio phage vB_VpaS_VP-RY-9]UFD98239.1 hypothetical protein S1R3X_000031 [Vibrio phage vB_ValS_VA-RY-4]WGH28422.1 hypothetical protein 13VO501A_gene0039 [Vibrio phage 13VO501A]